MSYKQGTEYKIIIMSLSHSPFVIPERVIIDGQITRKAEHRRRARLGLKRTDSSYEPNDELKPSIQVVLRSSN